MRCPDHLRHVLLFRTVFCAPHRKILCPPVIKEQTRTEDCSPVLGANSNFLKMAVDNNMKEALLAIFSVFLQEFLDSDNEMILLQKNMDDDVSECGKLLGLLDRNKIPKIERSVELNCPE